MIDNKNINLNIFHILKSKDILKFRLNHAINPIIFNFFFMRKIKDSYFLSEKQMIKLRLFLAQTKLFVHNQPDKNRIYKSKNKKQKN